MLENEKNVQITLYVTQMSRPLLLKSGCKDGHCLQVVMEEGSSKLPKKFYPHETQLIINSTKRFCKRLGIALEIKDISGIVKGIKYLLLKGIIKTPVLEIRNGEEKIRVRSSHQINTETIAKFLNKPAPVTR